jgi:L-ascorbate metabolism protein UlaG (beta-lactamase superfamily)
MQNQHVDPAQAVLIHEDVRAKRSVAIHWGTFELADDRSTSRPRNWPRPCVRRGCRRSSLLTLKHGETLKLDQ